MGRIRALETKQRAGVLDSEKQGVKEENGNLIVRSKGWALLFIQQTCAMHLSRVLDVLREIVQVKVSTM